jgi:hypothetical protein
VTDPAAAAELRQRLECHDAIVGVVGLGSIGLPLAVAFAKAGLTAHREFDAARLVREARLVLDMRNLTGPLGAQPHVIRL